MKWRWDLLLAAVILAGAIVAHAFFARYAPVDGGVLDRLTGQVCHRAGCWKPGQSRFDAAWDSSTRALQSR